MKKNNDVVLEVIDLTKHYDKSKRGINNLNFKVHKGELHAFIGENGAGKTTTIKSIIEAYVNYSGEVLIDGILNKDPESRAKLGYVPEKTNFPKDVSAYTYLKSLALLSNVEKSEIDKKIDFYLEKFSIKDLKHLKPYSFSSGQKKKVLLIQALIHNPDFIIMDEPTANLDPTARFEFFNLIKELKDEHKTIFISTHVLSEIDKYADSLTLIHKGEIKYTGKKYDNLEKIFYEKIISN